MLVSGLIGFHHTVLIGHFRIFLRVVRIRNVLLTGFGIQTVLRQIRPAVCPVIFLAEVDLANPADCSIRVGNLQIDGNRIVGVVFTVVPELFHINGGGGLDPVLGIGNGEVSCLLLIVDLEAVDGEAVGNGTVSRIRQDRSAVGVQTVLVQGHLNDTLRNFVALSARCRYLLEVVGFGGAEAPHVCLSVFNGENIGLVAFSILFIGPLAGPQVAGLSAGRILEDGKLCAVEDLLGQHIFLLQGQGEPGCQIEVDGAVTHGRAAFQIEDGQGMLAGFDLIRDVAYHRAIHRNIAVGKVDITLRCQVDTAQVQNQLAVNQNPDIIVTGEVEVHIVAVEVLVAAGAHIIGKSEADIRPHTIPPVGIGGGVITLSGLIGIRILVLIIRNAAIDIGVRGIQRQEVRIRITGGVRRCFQIIVDIEPLLTLVIGRSVEPGIIVVVTVKFASGILIDLEQVITLAQVMLAHNIAWAKQCVKQRIIQHIGSHLAQDAGIHVSAFAGPYVSVTAVRRIRKVVVIIIVTPVIVNKGEIQRCLPCCRISRYRMGPPFAVGGCGYAGRGQSGGIQIDQGTVVKELGGDKFIGTHRIHHIGIVLTDVIGCRNPVRVQHCILCYGDRVAGGVVGSGCDIHPACQLILVVRRAIPFAGKLHRSAAEHRVWGIGRAPVAHEVAVGAVQPQGHHFRCLTKIDGGTTVLATGKSGTVKLKIVVVIPGTSAERGTGANGRKRKVLAAVTQHSTATEGQVFGGLCYGFYAVRVVAFCKGPVQG